MVTDYDCWKEEHCTVEEIMKVMKGNNEMGQKLLKKVIPRLGANRFDFDKENQYAVVTKDFLLNQDHKDILKGTFAMSEYFFSLQCFK